MAFDRGFARFGTSLADLRGAWRDRLEDAEVLRRSGRNSAAVMMGLYALEILLKVRICKKLDVEELPRAFETHDLEGLLVISGLSRRLRTKAPTDVVANWESIVDTSERLNDLRYSPGASPSETVTDEIFARLTGRPHGLISWLARQR